MSQQITQPVGVERVAETVLPTRHGTFRMLGYRGPDGTEHVALSMGIADERPPAVVPLVRLHSECLTGDALGSRRCDCGTQLDAALARIAVEGTGVLVYVRGHEGRGIGLLEKLRAYHLQDQGADTVDANLALGHPADARRYDQAAAVLRDLGITELRLMSSNPAKQAALAELGITVTERTGMYVPEFAENSRYLATKRARMSHDAPPPVDAWAELRAGRVPVSLTEPADVALVERYGSVAGRPRVVVAQMAQSLDGFIATINGDAAGLSGPDDLTHLHRLRALADAVVVGWRTVAIDDPQLTVRHVSGDNPTRVILDPHAQTPPTSRLLTEAAAPTLWLVGADAPELATAAHVEVVRLDAADFEPARLVEILAARGLGRLLIEGGGKTVSRFLAAGVLDRLYVTTVPVLLGAGIPGVRTDAVARVRDAARPATRTFALGADTCTEFSFG